MTFFSLKAKELRKTEKSSGFSLLEVIIVIAILAGVYGYAIPQFRLLTGLEESSVLTRLSVDIRSAYDVSVLTGRIHRLVFLLESGEYWLEETESKRVYLNVSGREHDSTEEEEIEERVTFEEDFKAYEDMMSSPIHDPENEVDIYPITPLIAAKKFLQRPKWKEIKNLEWQRRDLGSTLMITSFKAEHHSKKQVLAEGEEGLRVFLYFFPDGYVESAEIHITPTSEDEEKRIPYVMRTNPHEGTAIIDTFNESSY